MTQPTVSKHWRKKNSVGVCVQRILYARVQHCVSPQHHGETQEASGHSDGVGQSDQPLRQRRLRHGDAASVPASVHLHRLHGRRLARQAALQAATSRLTCTPEHPDWDEPRYRRRRSRRKSAGYRHVTIRPIARLTPGVSEL